MKKYQRYFVISNYTSSGIATFETLREAVIFAKGSSRRGSNTKIFAGEFIRGYDAEIKLIEDNTPDWT